MAGETQRQELEQAYSVADELAQNEGTQYPDEFLAHLQSTPELRPLFEEFVDLTDTAAREDETLMLLGELDGHLADWEAGKRAPAAAPTKSNPELASKMPRNIDLSRFPDDASLDGPKIEGGQIVVRISHGTSEAGRVTLTSKDGQKWQINGAINYKDFDSAMKDAPTIENALHAYQGIPGKEKPFGISPEGFLTFNVLNLEVGGSYDKELSYTALSLGGDRGGVASYLNTQYQAHASEWAPDIKKETTKRYVELMKSNDVMHTDRVHVEVTNGIVTCLIPCAGRDLIAVRKADGNWTLDGVPYDNDADGVFEDVWEIQYAMDKVQKKELVGKNQTPFAITGAGELTFDGKTVNNLFVNTFESDNNDAMERVLNEHYKAIVNPPAAPTAPSVSAETHEAQMTVTIGETRTRLDDLRGQYLFTDAKKVDELDKTRAAFDDLVVQREDAQARADFTEAIKLEPEIERMADDVRVDWEVNYIPPVSPSAAPAAPDTAPTADAALASTSAAPRAAVSVAPSTVEAAPEVAVDYRADAREHPEKYLTEGVSDTSIFTPPNDKANRAIRIEDLYHKDTEKPKLTSTRYPGMTFAYGNGADGNSWYDVAGSGKRLAILKGDTLTEVKDEPAPAVASSEAPAESIPPEATPQPEVAVEAPLSYGELRSRMAQLSNDTTYLESLPGKKKTLEEERAKWYTINKTYDADIAKIDADLRDYPANIKDQADTLSKQVGNPEYALALKDEFVGDDRRVALNLPAPTADASAIEAALAARTTNPSTDTEVQNTDAVADASQ